MLEPQIPNSKSSSDEILTNTPTAPQIISTEEAPVLIYGLNPKDPQDWITVFLSTIVVWNGYLIVSEEIKNLIH